MMRRPSALLVGVALTVATAACAGSGDGAALSRSEFVERADQICLETAKRFEAELPDPVGGAKPVGLGAFMRRWIKELRTLEPPSSVATDWGQGLDLLEQATHALDDAEAGDPDAQGEALWNLEPRAQKHFNATHLPFRVCFVE